jgi:hypothetical protein
VNATYPSDVKLLSDEELDTLSAELAEAYLSSNDDGDAYWSCDDAENRYAEMQAEISRRRWDRLTPEEQAAEKERFKAIMASTLETLNDHFQFSANINRDFDSIFSKHGKIGDTIKVKMPTRYGGHWIGPSSITPNAGSSLPSEPVGEMVED